MQKGGRKNKKVRATASDRLGPKPPAQQLTDGHMTGIMRAQRGASGRPSGLHH